LLIGTPRQVIKHRGNHFITGFKQQLRRDTRLTRQASDLPMRGIA